MGSDELAVEAWPPGAVALREYVEALIREQTRATEIAEREREKAAQIIREGMRDLIDAGDAALERHIIEQVSQVRAALSAQERFGSEVQRAAKEAVEKALISAKELAEKHNNLISQMDRDKEKYATKVDQVALREIIDKSLEILGEKIGSNEGRIVQLEGSIHRRTGQQEGVDTSVRNLIWAIGAIMAVVTVVVTVLVANGAI